MLPVARSKTVAKLAAENRKSLAYYYVSSYFCGYYFKRLFHVRANWLYDDWDIHSYHCFNFNKKMDSVRDNFAWRVFNQEKKDPNIDVKKRMWV